MDVGTVTPYLPVIINAVIGHIPTLTSSQALLIGGVGVSGITVVAIAFPELRSLLAKLSKTLYELVVTYGHWVDGFWLKAIVKAVAVVAALIQGFLPHNAVAKPDPKASQEEEAKVIPRVQITIDGVTYDLFMHNNQVLLKLPESLKKGDDETTTEDS